MCYANGTLSTERHYCLEILFISLSAHYLGNFLLLIINIENYIKTRKSSCVNARGILSATLQVYAVLLWLGVPSPPPILKWDLRGTRYTPNLNLGWRYSLSGMMVVHPQSGRMGVPRYARWGIPHPKV